MSEQKQKGISFGYCDVNTGARVYPPLLDSTTERLQSSRQDYQSPGSDMYANITCVPPIGQATIIPTSQATVRIPPNLTMYLSLIDSGHILGTA